MEENNQITTIDTKSLDSKTADVAQQIIDEENIDKIKDLTHLFNLNITKKNVLRAMKLNGLLDTVSDKMIERFEKTPDNFSNADLLNYMNVVQNSIDKTNKTLGLVDDTPAIQIINNEVNVEADTSLNRESRRKVLEYVNAVLTQAQQQDTIEIIQDEEGENTSDVK